MSDPVSSSLSAPGPTAPVAVADQNRSRSPPRDTDRMAAPTAAAAATTTMTPSPFQCSGSSEWPPRVLSSSSSSSSPATGAPEPLAPLEDAAPTPTPTPTRVLRPHAPAMSVSIIAVDPPAPASVGDSSFLESPGLLSSSSWTSSSESDANATVRTAQMRTPMHSPITPITGSIDSPFRETSDLRLAGGGVVAPRMVNLLPPHADDTPTRRTALSIMQRRLTALEMRENHTHASPLRKTSRGSAPVHGDHLDLSGGGPSSGSSGLLSPVTPASWQHGRSSSGALIPPPSPQFYTHLRSLGTASHDSTPTPEAELLGGGSGPASGRATARNSAPTAALSTPINAEPVPAHVWPGLALARSQALLSHLRQSNLLADGWESRARPSASSAFTTSDLINEVDALLAAAGGGIEDALMALVFLEAAMPAGGEFGRTVPYDSLRDLRTPVQTVCDRGIAVAPSSGPHSRTGSENSVASPALMPRIGRHASSPSARPVARARGATGPRVAAPPARSPVQAPTPIMKHHSIADEYAGLPPSLSLNSARDSADKLMALRVAGGGTSQRESTESGGFDVSRMHLAPDTIATPRDDSKQSSGRNSNEAAPGGGGFAFYISEEQRRASAEQAQLIRDSVRDASATAAASVVASIPFVALPTSLSSSARRRANPFVRSPKLRGVEPPPLGGTVNDLLCTLLGFTDTAALARRIPPDSIDWLREQCGCAVMSGAAATIESDAPLRLYLRLLVFEHASFGPAVAPSPPSSHAPSPSPPSSASRVTSADSAASDLGSVASSAPFADLCLLVRHTHFEGFAIKEGLAAFIGARRVALGVEAFTPSLREVSALFVGGGGGVYTRRLLEALLLTSAAGPSSDSLILPSGPFTSWSSFISVVRDRANELEATRGAEVDFFHALLARTRLGAGLLLPGLELNEQGLPGRTAISRAAVFQMIELVAHTAAVGVECDDEEEEDVPVLPMCGVVLLATLQSLAAGRAESRPLFEDLVELRRGILAHLASTAANSMSQLRDALDEAGAPITDDEFHTWCHDLRQLGFSATLLESLWRISPWASASDADKDRPLSLALFRQFCLTTAVAYSASTASLETTLAHVYLTSPSRPPLFSTSISDVGVPRVPRELVSSLFDLVSAMTRHRAAVVVLYLEVLLDHGEARRPTRQSREPIFHESTALTDAVLRLHAAHQVERRFVCDSWAQLSGQDFQDRQQEDDLWTRFASSLRMALTATIDEPSPLAPPSPLRLCLTQLVGSHHVVNAVAGTGAFLHDWCWTKLFVHLLLMALPIASIASPAAPHALLHSAVIVEETHLDQLLCIGGCARRTWATLLRMQAASTAATQATSWSAFIAQFAQMVQEPPEVLFVDTTALDSSWSLVHHLLFSYLSASFSRLVPPAALVGVTPGDIDTLCVSPCSDDRHSLASVFQLLLLLNTLDFDQAHLCDSLAHLCQLVDSARIERGHKEEQLHDLLTSVECRLFDGDDDNEDESDSVPSQTRAFRFRRGNLTRLSCYVGCGIMNVPVFRALGLEVRNADDDDDDTASFAPFLRRARMKVAQQELPPMDREEDPLSRNDDENEADTNERVAEATQETSPTPSPTTVAVVAPIPAVADVAVLVARPPPTPSPPASSSGVYAHLRHKVAMPVHLPRRANSFSTTPTSTALSTPRPSVLRMLHAPPADRPLLEAVSSALAPSYALRLTESDLVAIRAIWPAWPDSRMIDAIRDASGPGLRLFGSLDQLVDTLRATGRPATARTNSPAAGVAGDMTDLLVTKQHVLEYLASPSCALWSTPQSVHAADIDRLVQTTRHSNARLWTCIHRLRQASRRFDTLDALDEAVGQVDATGTFDVIATPAKTRLIRREDRTSSSQAAPS